MLKAIQTHLKRRRQDKAAHREIERQLDTLADYTYLDRATGPNLVEAEVARVGKNIAHWRDSQLLASLNKNRAK